MSYANLLKYQLKGLIVYLSLDDDLKEIFLSWLILLSQPKDPLYEIKTFTTRFVIKNMK